MPGANNTMRYCHRLVVCPRCSQHHEMAQCPMTGLTKCTVCNKEGHMATARDCPTRVDLMERRAKKNDPIPPPVQPVPSRRQHPSRNVQSNVAFAELLGGSSANQQQQPMAQPAPVTSASNNPVIEQLIMCSYGPDDGYGDDTARYDEKNTRASL
nr:uncharacterized protein LOC106677532 [Halyomorpha halys]